MADQIILLDTSVLIDYFRKKDKTNTFFFKLADRYSTFNISVITEYEIYAGAKNQQNSYWEDLLKLISVIPLDSSIIKTAVEINNDLKISSKQLDIADLFIASTAITFDMPCATLNTRHFERIPKLYLINQ